MGDDVTPKLPGPTMEEAVAAAEEVAAMLRDDDPLADLRAFAARDVEDHRAALIATTDRQSCLWLLGVLGEPLGLKPGQFTTHLIDAMRWADPKNRAKLARGYPELMAAVVLWKDHDDGHAIVARIATGQPVSDTDTKESK